MYRLANIQGSIIMSGFPSCPANIAGGAQGEGRNGKGAGRLQGPGELVAPTVMQCAVRAIWFPLRKGGEWPAAVWPVQPRPGVLMPRIRGLLCAMRTQPNGSTMMVKGKHST